MNAGRELDALVAEKVMGWTNLRFIGLRLFGEVDGEPSEKVPFYSDDIEAAWEVMEKLRESGDMLSLNWYPFADLWECIVHRLPSSAGKADTAPFAICLAALQAAGVEMPE